MTTTNQPGLFDSDGDENLARRLETAGWQRYNEASNALWYSPYTEERYNGPIPFGEALIIQRERDEIPRRDPQPGRTP